MTSHAKHWLRAASKFGLSATVLAAALTLSACAQARDLHRRVDGTNVTWVAFTACEPCRFEEHPDGQWYEIGREGTVRFEFQETGRDEWSVYLQDKRRDVQVQLDLWRRKISVGTGGRPRRDSYDVRAASEAVWHIR